MPIMMMLMCPAHVKNMLVRSASEIERVFEKVILRKFITSRAYVFGVSRDFLPVQLVSSIQKEMRDDTLVLHISWRPAEPEDTA
eukprot:CAMPEP_0182509070 /NCGR_PEP_ID=MMETSP1321-20130603/26192_1 /TAXON_ID=91990 /ORGANISM="Bolidomonas sp., Strain RCC1657" /LENGTH=83 /DNA_ID=CAMNT_0024715277 /DNA_START=271 /DNA_END=522 /DNA_ORIENTATION=+